MGFTMNGLLGLESWAAALGRPVSSTLGVPFNERVRRALQRIAGQSEGGVMAGGWNNEVLRLLNDAVTAAGATGGLTPTAVKTTDYSPAAGDLVLVNTATTGSLTLTFPASPAAGNVIAFANVATHASRTVTVAGNGNNVQAVTDDTFGSSAVYEQMILFAITYVYTSSGWVKQ